MTARLIGWLQAAHPFPLAAVLGLTALVGVASAGGDLDSARFALLLTAMLLSQLTIGWTNDYRDREHDRLYQPWKPVPSGRVAAPLLAWASLLAALASLGVGASLGMLPLLFLILGTGAGLAYDFGVKDTRLSWLPFVVALAVLPAFVWVSLDAFRDDFLWLYPIAAPLTVGAHVANLLPDIDGDATAGRSSIAVRLGRDGALRLLAVCLAVPLLLLALSLPWLDYEAPLLLVVLAGYGVLAAAGSLAYRRPGREAAVWAFRLVILAAVLFAAGWLAAV